jgi:hypothetical protein
MLPVLVASDVVAPPVFGARTIAYDEAGANGSECASVVAK